MIKLHLIKSGSAIATKSACGRNILQMHLALKWTDYKNEPVEYRCDKCEASKQALLNIRNDNK